MTKKESIQYIAVDVGYGDVKVAFEDKEFKFPSAVAKQKEAFANISGIAEDVYDFEGRQWKVGEKAIHDALTTRGYEFLIKYGALLIFAAMKKAGIDFNRPIHLATGLSIIDWERREELKKKLESFIVDNIKVVPAETVLYAQGQGIFKDSGVKEKLVLVIDIGYNTFDHLVFEDGSPDKENSYANRRGANKMITNIQKMVSRRCNVDITEQNAKEIFLSKSYKIAGVDYDLSQDVEDEQSDYSEEILGEIENSSAIYKRADKVIFSGGGSYYVDPKKLPRNAVYSPKPFEFSNVRGYLKMLRS